MKITVKVDRTLCQSVATCVAIAPEVYELDDEFKAIVKGTNAKRDGDTYSYEFDGNQKDLDQALDGAKACPYSAILIYDDKGKKIYPRD